MPGTNPEMCQYESIHFSCGHVGRRLIKHCHFARNDPNHQCFGAWSIKREWTQPRENCAACIGSGLPQRVIGGGMDPGGVGQVRGGGMEANGKFGCGGK